MMIRSITDGGEKERIARELLEGLTEWFEVEESREGYISDSKDWIFFASEEDGLVNGFLCLKETGKATVELAVMGVLKEYHRRGVGRALYEHVLAYARENGFHHVTLNVWCCNPSAMEFYEKCGLVPQKIGMEIIIQED